MNKFVVTGRERSRAQSKESIVSIGSLSSITGNFCLYCMFPSFKFYI